MKTTIRILLTGASGYLGQFLLESFLNNKNNNQQDSDGDTTLYHIHAIHHSNPNLKDAIDKYQQKQQQSAAAASNSSSSSQPRRVTVQVDSLDLGDSDAVTNYIKRQNHPIDVCIHAAAISSPKACFEQPDLARRVNIPKPLFDALMDQQQQGQSHSITIIAMSTDQVYDGLEPPYTEMSKPNPPNQYGQTKLEMEEYLLDKVKENPQHVKLYLLRSSLIFGPNAPFRDMGVKTKDTFLHFIASRNGVATDFYTDEIRCCISVRDVVRIINSLVVINNTHSNEDNGGGGNNKDDSCCIIYNMGGPNPINRYDMAKAVFEHLGYDTACLHAKVKSEVQPPPAIKTPMNLTMRSTKIQKLVSLDKLMNFDEIIHDTFGPSSSS